MRRLSSLCIVLLLVFRGLLGDAMAMGAAGCDHHAPAVPHAHQPDAAPRPAGEDVAAQGRAPDDKACKPAHGASCAACAVSRACAADAVAGVRPPELHSRFASVWPRQAVKPPIS